MQRLPERWLLVLGTSFQTCRLFFWLDFDLVLSYKWLIPALLPHPCNRSSLETMTGLSLSPTDFWGPSKLATLESILSRGEVGSQWGLNFMAALLVRETGYKLTKRNLWVRTPLVSCRTSFPVSTLRLLSQVSPYACPLPSAFRLFETVSGARQEGLETSPPSGLALTAVTLHYSLVFTGVSLYC